MGTERAVNFLAFFFFFLIMYFLGLVVCLLFCHLLPSTFLPDSVISRAF